MRRALADLRRTRRLRRLGDTEWFDLAYRVYLAAFFGGSAIIIVSDQVGDRELSGERVADVVARGPAWLGLLVVGAVAIGLRSGSLGGPVTVESADVQHLMLAPVSRAAVLRRPFWQRLRTVAGGSALAGGVAGLLAEQRIPSSAGWWTWWGAVLGLAIGAVMVATATIAHAVRLPGWLAVVLGGCLLGWQSFAALGERAGPGDALGGIALRDVAPHDRQLVAIAGVAAIVVVAHLMVGRLRLEPLARRGALVSQLRFAVTMQDLRTVVLLRRQLRQEYARVRSWMPPMPVGSGPGAAVARRSLAGVGRTPLGRLGRMVAVGGLAGAAAGVAVRGTTPMVLVSGTLLFVLGLDLIEPLSQEIDHPDRTATLPRPDGWIHAWLLTGPLVIAVPIAVVGATACAAVAPDAGPAAFALAVPTVWAGMVGAVVNAVRDQFDPSGPRSRSSDLVVPMEVSGVQDVVRLLWPVVLSTAPMLALLAVRAQPGTGMVLRATAGLVLWLAAARWWLVHRHSIRRRWRDFAAGPA
jgi:hypothetical protein